MQGESDRQRGCWMWSRWLGTCSSRAACSRCWPSIGTGCSRRSCSLDSVSIRTWQALDPGRGDRLGDRAAGVVRALGPGGGRRFHLRPAVESACGYAIDAKGFDSSTLTYWRTRLAASDRPQRIFEVVREVIDRRAARWPARQRRALDSTVLDDAVARQDTVTQLIAQIRRVGREVPERERPDRHPLHPAGWVDRAGLRRAPRKPPIAWDDAAAREELVSALVGDALALLGRPRCSTAIDRGRGAEAGRGGRAAGAGRRPGRGTGRGIRWHRRPLADRPQDRSGPGDLDRRPRCPARTQDPGTTPGRVQGPRRGRARHRADHRREADQDQRPGELRRHRRCRPGHHRRHDPCRWRPRGPGRLGLRHRRHAPHPGGQEVDCRCSSRGRPSQLSRAASPSTTSPTTPLAPTRAGTADLPRRHHPPDDQRRQRHLQRRLPRTVRFAMRCTTSKRRPQPSRSASTTCSNASTASRADGRSLPGHLPPAPADGRTFHRLAHQRRSPRPLPRRREEQQLAPPPRRRPQPAATPRHGPHPPGRDLGHSPESRGTSRSDHTRPSQKPTNAHTVDSGGRTDLVSHQPVLTQTRRPTALAAIHPPPRHRQHRDHVLFSSLLGIRERL